MPIDRDYVCGSAFCDDPVCNTHGAKNADGELLFWLKRDFEQAHAPTGYPYRDTDW